MGKDQEFLEAARNGNLSYIEKVLTQKAKRVGPLASLRRGTGINAQDSGGYSALHHACLNGHIDIVRLLLSHDAQPNLPDSRGSSPLHLAAWAGEDEIVKMLLTQPYRPANPNLQTIENETPLHCAAQHGHTESLAVLLAHDADPNMRNARGETPLDLAAQYGRLQAVQMLIRAHPELIVPYTSEAIARQHNNGSMQCGQHAKSRHNSPLPHSGSVSTPSPSSPSPSPTTPTRCIFPHTCLHLASRNGHKAVVEVLLAAGVSVNLLTPSGSALHEAALCGKESVVRTLLKAGIDLNATDAEGRTALDILKEFPPHVTKHIIAVINNFRNQMDTEDSEEVIYRHHPQQPAPPQRTTSNANSHFQKQQHNNHYHFNSNNHLLNHSHSMQTGAYNRPGQRYGGASMSFNGKSLDSGLQPEDYVSVGGVQARNYHDINSPVHSHSNYSQNEIGVSPSSSMSSFEPAAVSPRSRSSTGNLIGQQMHMSTFAPAAPPKKPPRRNLSVSPTNTGQHFTYTSPNHNTQHTQQQQNANSMRKQSRSPSNDSPYSHQSHGSVGGMSFDESQLRERQRSDKLYASARESNRSAARLAMSASNDMLEQCYSSSNEQNLENIVPNANQENSSSIKRPTPAPRKTANISKEIINCENPTLKSYNPNRKLKRNRNSYSLTLGDKERCSLSSDSNSDSKQQDIPQSPTHYQQPPTPDHPPPSASTAERTIHERVRPLSQEYKRRSALLQLQQQQQQLMVDSSTSPPRGVPVPPPTVPMDYAYAHAAANATKPVPLYHAGHMPGSSGSLSSSVSLSDHSVSTEGVEEYVGDAPFAGLLKGAAFPGVTDKQQQQRIRPPIPTKPQLSERNVIKPSVTQQQHVHNESDAHNNNNNNNNNNNTDEMLAIAKTTKDNVSHQSVSVSVTDVEANESSNEDTTTTTTETGPKELSCEEGSLLSPFNAEEARKKISEIIESFGSGILSTDLTPAHDIELDFDELDVPPERYELALRLRSAGLLHLERMLSENGYDNYKFLHGVFADADVELMQITEPDASKLIKFVQTLPKAEFKAQAQQEPKKAKETQPSSEQCVSTLAEWLASIQLPEYLESFNKHLYNTIDNVCGVWDVELQTVLEINKVGHRRRILQSLAYIRHIRDPKAVRTPLAESNETNKLPTLNGNKMGNSNNKEPTAPVHQNRASITSYRKSRPAPQPPSSGSTATATTNVSKQNSAPLQIRNPSELLLGLPSHLCTKWRHTANVLLNEQIKYEVYYLGSTVVKELRGTESTRKSIQKFKRDERTINSTATATTATTTTNITSNMMSSRTNSNAINRTTAQQPMANHKHKRALVCLAISHRGVEYLDVNNKHRTICEHEIQNINCACQDADDLKHFAYITKDHDVHYCHVFAADSTELATEIILTLGQAFEVAYQLALRDGITATPYNNGMLQQSSLQQQQQQQQQPKAAADK